MAEAHHHTECTHEPDIYFFGRNTPNHPLFEALQLGRLYSPVRRGAEEKEIVYVEFRLYFVFTFRLR